MDLPPPEDEQFFNAPQNIPGLQLGDTLNSDNVLWYFSNSQFFDHASINHAYTQWVFQTMPENERSAVLRSRKNFEQGMRMYARGSRFVVVDEPKGPGMPWVIQKQFWEDGQLKEVEATYYSGGVDGTTFFKAPNLRDILNSRLVCSLFCLEGDGLANQTVPYSSPYPFKCKNSSTLPPNMSTGALAPDPRTSHPPSTTPPLVNPPNLPSHKPSHKTNHNLIPSPRSQAV